MVAVPLVPNSETDSTSVTMLMPGSRKRAVLILFAVCICGALLMCVYIVKSSPALNQYEILKSYRSESISSAPRTILLWNSFFGDKRWKLPDDKLGPAYFREQKCQVTQCEITNYRDFLPSIDMYDAILFHTAEPFPLVHPVPKSRDPRQLYVFALMEPPGETKHVLGDEGGFYNLTMAYRLDSDIVWPYQYIEDLETGAMVAPVKSPMWRRPPREAFFDAEVNSLMKTKTRFAAWIVSHCETLSKREELTRSLQKHINVDVFGKCGKMKCPRNSTLCDDLLDQNYKFFFAFENSLCKDYVTEKFYNALKRLVVPVVFGGADYNRFAPPHSYIDAEKFDSAKELAEYLKYLDGNPAEYMRYFWWRHHYKLGYRSPLCDLCEQLHSPATRQKVQIYHNIEEWWLGGSCRFQSKIDL